MIMRRILFFFHSILFSETFRSTLLAISAHTISGFFFFLANETQWGQQETITNWRELRDFLVIRLD